MGSVGADTAWNHETDRHRSKAIRPTIGLLHIDVMRIVSGIRERVVQYDFLPFHESVGNTWIWPGSQHSLNVRTIVEMKEDPPGSIK